MTPVLNFLITTVAVFIMGLGLNLTPCVYPMISVTLSLFSGQKETGRRAAFLRALVYVAGIATMYSTLGVVAAMTGQLFGGLLQNRWVLVAIAFAMIALAMSLFGFYQIQMPSWLLNKFGKRQGAGFMGVYFSGLLVGIFAAPCVGPPIIALLTFVGTKGDPLLAFWMFFVLSLGLGLPYLLLGTYSGLIRKFPKSGIWMIWVERFFGFILIVLAAFYVFSAFQPALLKWLLPLALVGGGVFLGFVESSGNQLVVFQRLKRALGVIAISIGILIPLSVSKQGVIWEPYQAEKLAAATEAGESVILDFYASWCIPCHELERFTYSNPDVIKAFSPFRKFKVDLTSPNDPKVVDLVQHYNIVGVPAVIFLDPDGREIESARISGFIPANELLTMLNAPDFQKRLKR
ncbi:MAG: cytochrome c biogenesis protein CcdA [Candidatus Omnitrophica bacterium]|nr:cytochrome c biogenesis protein CcdA [Candidatus Omnitrophota bacterium]MDD5670774.1 cytochrome c biogenesis protein CcdA [Candidatus Omnitrophota bacterium]